MRPVPDPAQHARLERATAHLDAPFVAIDLDAFDANAADLARRAAGIPIRVASKSVRVRALLERVLHRPGGAFAGVLALTLPEALHLVAHGTTDDVLVAYPSVDGTALRALSAGADRERGARIVLMVDDVAQLDLVRSAGATADAPVRVALELDASLRLAGGRVHLGPRRSSLHTPAQLADFAAEVVRRPELELVGVMAYEGQIAGVGDATPGARLRGRAVAIMQQRSRQELAGRRAAAVEAVETTIGRPLELVNAGGTGSLESSAAEDVVTEVAAGSGLHGSALFDGYRVFTPRPALFLALPVVRRPAPGMVTAQGGGWIASGPPGVDRQPLPWFPAGLRLVPSEGAGEAQTPLTGAAADGLAIGDRVWLRPSKAGEPLERVDVVHLVQGDVVVATEPTYRGDGQAFG